MRYEQIALLIFLLLLLIILTITLLFPGCISCESNPKTPVNVGGVLLFI